MAFPQTAGHDLLIMACSMKKDPAPGFIPAFERYTGPTWRVLAKARGSGTIRPGIKVMALSGAHGFIPDDQRIQSYDAKIEDEKDITDVILCERADRRLAEPLDHAREVYFVGGWNYREVVRQLLGWYAFQRLAHSAPPGAGIGLQLAHLGSWLRNGTVPVGGRM